MQHGALLLANLIARKNVHDLEILLSSRYIANPQDAQDPLGLALQLMKQDSLNRIVKQQRKDHLVVLQTGDLTHADTLTIEHLSSVGLLGFHEASQSHQVLPEVKSLVANYTFSTQPKTEHAPNITDNAVWPVTAATSTRQASEIVRRIQSKPLKLSVKDKVSVVTLRDLADELHLSHHTVTYLVAILTDSGVLKADRTHTTAHKLVASEIANSWLLLDAPDRWLIMLSACLGALSEQLRQDTVAQDGRLGTVLASLSDDYPLMTDTEIAQLFEILNGLSEIGAAIHGDLIPAANAMLQQQVDRAQQITLESFIAPIEGVYLQPDLSVIVPGLLNPRDELMLSRITEPEHIGVSSSLRISQRSLIHAATTISIAEITEFLQRISLTGLPQPLQFTLDELATKNPNTSPSAVTAEHSEGFHAPDLLTAVYETLSQQITPEVSAIAHRIVDAASQNEGDLGRKLEFAIRHKDPVIVTAVSGAEQREFTLMPVSLSGGRLRATDQRAGVERTLPLSAIVSVVAA